MDRGRNQFSSDGHPFHCLQSTTEVEADGPGDAVKRVLCDMRGAASDWGIGVMPLNGAAMAGERLAVQG
jgi:hypothetical protein